MTSKPGIDVGVRTYLTWVTEYVEGDVGAGSTRPNISAELGNTLKMEYPFQHLDRIRF